MQKFKSFMRSSCSAAAVLAMAAPVLAQDETADDSGGNSVLEEIIVTAQLREQSLQEVPISLTAIGGDTLQTRQIDSFDQLQFVVPGINFTAGLSARQSATTIRGIGTSLFNEGIEGSVAIVIDGIVMGREGAGLFDLSDIERVEVLRGPQGTLFGKNASAGVVSIITRKPSDEFEANANISYGSFDEINASGSVSGALTDSVSARVSGYYNTRDGYVTNVLPDAPNSQLNERDEFGVRAKFYIEATDTLNILVSGDYSSRDQSSGALTLRSISDGGPGTGLLGSGVPVTVPANQALGVTPGPQNTDIASNGAFFLDMEAYGGSVDARWDIGEYRLISITGWRRWDTFDENDADLTPLPLLSVNTGDLNQEQFSQEFRLESPSDGPLSYVVGAFFFDQSLEQRAIQGGTAGLDILGLLPPGVLLATDFRSTIDERNMAIFGQGNYAITDDLSVIFGGRLLNSEISGTQLRSVAEGFAGPFPGHSLNADVFAAETDDTAFVWRFGLEYNVNDDVKLFATASRGYKSAGIVTGFGVDPAEAGSTVLPTVDPETATQYEAGLRSTLLDGRLQANITTFYTEVEDFQAQALVPRPGGIAVFSVANAGEVETYGFEADITYKPVDGLTLSTAIAYTDATYASFPEAPCYVLQPVGPNQCIDQDGDGTGDFQNLAGQRLAQSPEWVVNSLARYDWNVVNDINAFVQVGAQFQSERFSTATGDPDTIIDDIFLVDAQVGVSFMDGRYSITGFVRNLTDENFAESIVGTPLDDGGYSQFLTLENFQTWGVRLSAQF